MMIKNIKLKHGLILAPIAGVTDNAFRQICKNHGAEYVVSEMVSAKAVNYGNKKTIPLIKLEESELPGAVQLFGSEPESMSSAARFILDNFKISAIDINMGCPMPKIVNGGDGCALMREPALAGRIMASIVKAAGDLPATVKIRSGWDKHSKNAVEIAKIAENSGIAAITVHGRTREQMYMPPVDLDSIRDVKKAVRIPVIGNGDIYSFADAKNMFEHTGCDAIMIARGSFGNPWIFSEITAGLEGRPYTAPNGDAKLKVIREHLDKLIFYKGERTALLEARKHLAWYIKGCKNSAEARNKINESNDYSEMLDIVGKVMLWV
jgi:nifR3 family TIM-barrel protein